MGHAWLKDDGFVLWNGTVGVLFFSTEDHIANLLGFIKLSVRRVIAFRSNRLSVKTGLLLVCQFS